MQKDTVLTTAFVRTVGFNVDTNSGEGHTSSLRVPLLPHFPLSSLDPWGTILPRHLHSASVHEATFSSLPYITVGIRLRGRQSATSEATVSEAYDT
jgi:hypothetical protein